MPAPSSPSDGRVSRTSATSRFWRKVTPVAQQGWICLVWTGSLANGYGRFWLKGRLVPAHRLAWEMANGPIPSGMQLDHLCRMRSCVRPDHLEPVTQRENLRRGVGWAGVNAQKTACPVGHPYANGTRRCATCRKDQNARYWAARRERLSGRPGSRARTCRLPASG
ncbi:MAG: HNH endonuclease signature motif containing protein, partial [Candidatus Limnocylindrales bacterium]